MPGLQPDGAIRSDGQYQHEPQFPGAGFSGEAYAIAWCESRGDDRAVNGTSYGRYQINYPYHLDKLEAVTGRRDPNLLFDPAINEAVARLVYAASGNTWSAWACAYAAEEP